MLTVTATLVLRDDGTTGATMTVDGQPVETTSGTPAIPSVADVVKAFRAVAALSAVDLSDRLGIEQSRLSAAADNAAARAQAARKAAQALAAASEG